MTDSTALRPADTDRTVGECVALADQVALGATGITVDSREMYDIAASELVAVNKALATLEEKRMSITRPMDQAKKAVMDLFRPATDKLEALKSGIGTAMLTWKKADDARIERERQAAEQKRREELAELERKAAAERAKAETLTGRAASNAQARLEATEAAIAVAEVAPLPPVAASASARGVSTAKRWKVARIDLAGLVAAAAANPDLLIYLTPDEVQLNALATALKAHAKVPGVTFEEVESTRVSRR